jgi:hypothetical protein
MLEVAMARVQRIVVRGIVMAGLALIAGVAPAFAQNSAPAETGLMRVGKVEIGGNAAAIAAGSFFGGAAVVAWSPQVAWNLTRSQAIQLTLDIGVGGFDDGEFGGLYELQYRRVVRENRKTRVCQKFGVAGAFLFEHYEPYVYTVPAYSYVRNGETVAVPERTTSTVGRDESFVSPPFMLTYGYGWQQDLGRGVSMRSDVGLGISWGIVGVRGSVGLVVPIGRAR